MSSNKTEEIPTQYLDSNEVFDESKFKLPKHSEYDCKIEFKRDVRLTRSPIYPLSQIEELELKRYLNENLKKGYIRKSNSSVTSPVIFRKKKDGSLQVCIDYRKLKKQMVEDDYSLPIITELYESVKGSTIFTRLNLRSAFNSIRVRAGDEYKTAISTKFGIFEYLVMPHGLPNGPSVYQAFIEGIFKEVLNKYVKVYMDDILIYSKNLNEHIQHVRSVLKILIENKLVAKLEKCEFHKSEIRYLGDILTKDGVKTDPEKVNKIMEMSKPKNVCEIQSFMGTCNYFRRFVPNFATVIKPINMLLRKNQEFEWNDECQKAFDNVKHLILNAPILSYPDQNKQYIVNISSSDYAISATLSQRNDTDELKPIYYFSRILRKPEFNYTSIEKEMLALKQSFAEWRNLLLQAKHQTLVYTKCENLYEAIQRQPPLSQVEDCWQKYLSDFDYKIIYRSNKSNTSGVIYRMPINPVNFNFNDSLGLSGIIDEVEFLFDDYQEEFASDDLQSESNYSEYSAESDETCHEPGDVQEIKYYYDYDHYSQEIINDIKNGHGNSRCASNWLLIDGLLVRKNNIEQVYIPSQLRDHYIQTEYESESQFYQCLSCNKFYKIFSEKYWWPGIKQDIKRYYNENIVRSSSTSPVNTTTTPEPIYSNSTGNAHSQLVSNLPSTLPMNENIVMGMGMGMGASVGHENDTQLPWKRVYFDFHEDFVMSLKKIPGTGKCNLVIFRDELTKMVQFVGFDHRPTPSETAQAFLDNVFRMFGPPSEIISESPIRSQEWKQIFDRYHIQNKVAERNTEDKDKAYVGGFARKLLSLEDELDWMTSFNVAQLCFNNTIHPSTNKKPTDDYNSRNGDGIPIGGNVSLMENNSPSYNNYKHVLQIFKYKIFGDNEPRTSSNSSKLEVGKFAWLKKPSDYKVFPEFKLETRIFGPFFITHYDESSHCYQVKFEASPFPIVYPVFHASELLPYEFGSTYARIPYSIFEVLEILDTRCRRLRNGKEKYEYHIQFEDYSERWIDADELEDSNYYHDLIADYQENLYDENCKKN